MTRFKLAAALGLALLAIILIYQNTAPMEVRFLFITLEMPRAALLTMVLLAGIALGILISLVLAGRFPEKKGEEAEKKEGGRQGAEP
jgi:lipopolysaccharide assembly protein A